MGEVHRLWNRVHRGLVIGSVFGRGQPSQEGLKETWSETQVSTTGTWDCWSAVVTEQGLGSQSPAPYLAEEETAVQRGERDAHSASRTIREGSPERTARPLGGGAGCEGFLPMSTRKMMTKGVKFKSIFIEQLKTQWLWGPAQGRSALMSCAPPVFTSPEGGQRGGRSCL